MKLSTPSGGDVIAGLSVALVVIPQSLAYAELAGLPSHFGLFASALPALLAAAFVSSPYLQTGPVALTSLLTFGALQGFAEPQSSDYIKLAALLALMVGLTRLLLGLVRLGGLAYLLSDPVLTGFTTGAAILIFASQLPKVVGLEGAGDGVLQDAFAVLRQPGDWEPASMVFAAGALVAMFGGRRVHRLFPGVLLAVVAGTVISGVIDFDGSVIGDLPGGFLSLSADLPWSSVGDLALPALAIALVGFAEPSSIARTFAAEERMPWDANREMVSQGVANLAAGFTGAFPVGGSFSRSALNREAGATSAWAGAITGAFVFLALPFTPLLEALPRSILGAIVLGAVIKLIRFRSLIDLLSQSFPQALVGFGTFVATLAFAPRVERGVLAGIFLAVAVHLFREMTVTATSTLNGDTVTVAPQGVLWFATIPEVERQIRYELAGYPEVSNVVLDLGGVGRLDITGAAAIERIVSELSAAGCTVSISNIPPGAARAVSVHLSGTPGVPQKHKSARGPASRPGPD